MEFLERKRIKIATADTAVFRMENIDERFRGVGALSEVNLSVEQSRIMGLKGSNGAGKTTLLSAAASIYKPDFRGISIEGEKWGG